MDNFNPSNPKPQKAWNSETQDKRLGFALRDARTTEATGTPQVIPKLGLSYQQFMSRSASAMVGVDRRNYPTWNPAPDDSYATVPGIFAIEFEPVFALHDQLQTSETADIFINKWTQMRILYNGTKEFQPQDMQIMYCGLMELKAHLANIRRILNIMKSVISHELNMYYYGEALVASLGFAMTETEMRRNWTEWWQKYNVSLLGNLAKVRWFQNLVPGEDRWAGMCTELYKDNPEYTDYAQIYHFSPRYVNMLTSQWDSTNRTWAWTFEKEMYRWNDLGVNGVNAFNTYLNLVYRLMRNIFYDDSSAVIIATINAIAERNLSSQIGAEYIKYELLPFEGEEVKLTYDLNTLIAIHNATFIPAFVDVPHQDIESGTLTQEVLLTTRMAQMGSSFGKVLNLPNFGATTADIINATQWTIVSLPAELDPSATQSRLRVNSCGTEILTRAKIYTFVWGTDEAGNWNRTWDSYTSVDLTGTIPLWNEASVLYLPLSNAGTYSNGQVSSLWDQEALLSAFAYAPIQYRINASDADATHNPIVKAVSGQMEVMYNCDFATLLPIHRQFIRNFWGYPVDIPESATFKTSYSD